MTTDNNIDLSIWFLERNMVAITVGHLTGNRPMGLNTEHLAYNNGFYGSSAATFAEVKPYLYIICQSKYSKPIG